MCFTKLNYIFIRYTQFPIKWTDKPIQVLGIWITNNEQKLFELNYQPIVNKIDSILDTWAHRDLSLIGKITVVNTLISSLLVYKMQVLPNMPQKTIKLIENKIRAFIWNKKKAKISLRILQKNKADGGLGLVDIKQKEKSIKVAWIQILENNAKAANLAYYFLNNNIREDLWHCNLRRDHITVQLFPNCCNNTFWLDVLRAWAEINYKVNNVMSQSIWFNSNILIENSPFFWKKNYQRGLLWVSQLYHDAEIISIGEAKELYDLSYLELYSLYRATKVEEIGCITTALSFYETKLITKNLTAKVYKELCQDQTVCDKIAIAWSNTLNQDIPSHDIAKYIKKIYCCTNATKLRSFQYRLIFRALVLNTHLCKWGLTPNNICQFCKEAPETLLHLFCQCEITQNLWDCVVEKDLEKPYCVEPINIIFNTIDEKRLSKNNFICLLFKQHVYAKRCLKQNLSHVEFQRYMFRMKNIEKYNAIRTNNVSKFNIKWCESDMRASQPQDLVEFVNAYLDHGNPSM